MAIPGEAANAGQIVEREPEGIRRLREEYGPEVVEEILADVRRGVDDVANGRVISLADALERWGI